MILKSKFTHEEVYKEIWTTLEYITGQELDSGDKLANSIVNEFLSNFQYPVKEKKKVMMAVAAVNGIGDPDIWYCYVKCTQENIDDGDHYTFVAELCEDEGYEPHLAFDEYDSAGKALMEHFDWSTAHTYELE